MQVADEMNDKLQSHRAFYLVVVSPDYLGVVPDASNDTSVLAVELGVISSLGLGCINWNVDKVERSVARKLGKLLSVSYFISKGCDARHLIFELRKVLAVVQIVFVYF